MVRNKTLVLVCAVLAVGLFVLPSALSLFAGQHQFIEGEDVQCGKCHGAEYDELKAGTAHEGMSCQFCHQTKGHAKGDDGGGMSGTQFSSDAQHASISPQCIVCHDNVAVELNAIDESHTEFYRDAGADDATLMEGANEACIGCHTHIGVNITWQRATTLSFTAGHDAGEWVLSDFTAEGTNETTTSGGGY